MRALMNSTILLMAAASLSGTRAQEALIAVQADEVLHRVSRYLAGACIEDVNHEIHGGV